MTKLSSSLPNWKTKIKEGIGWFQILFGRFLHWLTDCKVFFFFFFFAYKRNSEHSNSLSSSLVLFSAVKPTEEHGVVRTEIAEAAKKAVQFCLSKQFSTWPPNKWLLVCRQKRRKSSHSPGRLYLNVRYTRYIFCFYCAYYAFWTVGCLQLRAT